MRMQRTLGLLLLSVLPCEVSFAQHSDLELFNAGGQVGVEPQIAEGEFGEALNPAYRASDPGLESDPGELLLHGETPLPAGAIVGYELVPFTLEGTTKTLFYWNGAGSPDFVSHSFAHRLKVSDPTESFSFQYDNLGLSGGLDFALTSDGDGPDPAGFLHTHLLFDLIDATGQPAAIPTAGVYAFATTFSVAGLADSEPVYWLLAAGADEEIHEAAVDYISRAVGIVPEPTTLVLVCFSLLPVAGRRKRRSRTRAGAR